jgi:hypothetical protein
MSGGSRVDARNEGEVGERGSRGDGRRADQSRGHDLPARTATYRSPVLVRHGPLRGLTRGGSVGTPEDFISATQAGT